MALIKCPECDNLVSDTCEYCIHCGFNLAKENVKEVDLKDFEIVSGKVLKKYIGSKESVVIPECVETIGYGAFQNCLSLKHVLITKNIKRIEENAFAYCNNLTNVEFQGIDHLDIHYQAFECESNDHQIVGVNHILWDVKTCTTLSDGGLFAIGAAPFCGKIFEKCTDIVLSENVEEIPSWFFNNFKCLKKIIIPYSTKRICPYGLDSDSVIDIVMENPSGWHALIKGRIVDLISASDLSDSKKAVQIFHEIYLGEEEPFWGMTTFIPYSFERR